ncbi:MAG: hypothetical protein ACOCZL_06010 [Bacteroidota bacterium]
MEKLEKISGLAILFMLASIFSCSKQEKIPVTSSSQDAIILYDQSIEAMESAYITRSNELLGFL